MGQTWTPSAETSFEHKQMLKWLLTQWNIFFWNLPTGNTKQFTFSFNTFVVFKKKKKLVHCKKQREEKEVSRWF